MSFQDKEGKRTVDNQTKSREEYRQSLSSVELPTVPTAPITLSTIEPSTINHDINVVNSSRPVTQASSSPKKKRKGSVAFSAAAVGNQRVEKKEKQTVKVPCPGCFELGHRQLGPTCAFQDFKKASSTVSAKREREATGEWEWESDNEKSRRLFLQAYPDKAEAY